MTTTTTSSQDERLRALVAGADPLSGDAAAPPQHLWARIADDVAAELAASRIGGHQGFSGASQDPVAPGSRAENGRSSSPARSGSAPRRTFVRRHWQAGLLAAAAVATLALATGTVLPDLVGGAGGDSSTAAGSPTAPQEEGAPASGRDSVGSGEDAPSGSNALGGEVKGDVDVSATDSAGGAAAAADPTVVRSGSVVVGTGEIQAGRDRFVAEVLRMDGMLVSETVSTNGDTSLTSGRVAPDMGISYPYPYPSGPGVWLTVKVPAASYDEAMAVARSTGDVVQLQQSSYDVGAQITDVRARIAVLTASLKRLDGLMEDANSVADVIRLENAIAERQSELDSLLAQQRELAEQTQMSQISLTLMSPEDARQVVDPEPQLTWWESFVRGLSQFWSWLGHALLVVSPLLIVGAILLWIRRRRRRSPTTPEAGPAPEAV